MNDHHNHKILHANAYEYPTIFSRTFTVAISHAVSGVEVTSSLITWMEEMKQWTNKNKYLIGHIKVFAENEEKESVWLATTSREVNVKGSPYWNESLILSYTLHMTVIVFGPEKDDLEIFTLQTLKKTTPL